MPIDSNEIQYLCKNGCEIDAMPELKRLVPFDDMVCNFFADLSAEIMKNPKAKVYPDVITFGFFCRKSNIGNLKNLYTNRIIKRLGRGLSFHIAPSNVPINFAYSLAAALLAGNACIVRASSKSFMQTDIICECINQILWRNEYRKLADYIKVVKYAHNSKITDYFSSIADIRVIWGGDHTIAEIRKSPIPPRSIEIAFADRYSAAIIDAESIIKCSNMEQLARNFYNDTYLYDQNACSSPRLIYWLGNKTSTEKAQIKFWSAVHEFIKGIYQLEPIISVNKYTASCRAAIDFGAEITPFHDNLINRIQISSLKKNLPDYRCAGGSFIEYRSKDIEDLGEIITQKYQTLSYFGIDSQFLADFVILNGLSGIDRIVPIGKTADFSLLWDGYDLIMHMSRAISF